MCRYPWIRDNAVVREVAADGRSSKEVSISEAFMAGLCAGSVEAIVATPFDILKLRGQVAAVQVPATGVALPKPHWNLIEQSLVGLPHAHPQMLPSIRTYPWLENGTGQPPLIRDVAALKRLTDVEGLDVLWRGLRPGIFRDALYAGVFFGSWQYLYEMMLEWKVISMETKPRYPPSTVSFAAFFRFVSPPATLFTIRASLS